MKLYAVYDVATGRILFYGRAQYDSDDDGGASMALQAGAGQTAMPIAEFPDASQTYAPSGVMTERPDCPISADVVGRVVTLSGVPVGSAYTIKGDAQLEGVATEPVLALSFVLPGTYLIEVPCFPAKDYAQGITLA